MGNCIVKSNTYSDSYLSGTATYTSDLFRAKIFDEREIPKHISEGNDKVILLDSKEGLELIVNEIASLDVKIPEAERRLRNMKEGREALYNGNPEMVSEYIKMYNKRYNNLIGISFETKKKIIEEIVKKEK